MDGRLLFVIRERLQLRPPFTRDEAVAPVEYTYRTKERLVETGQPWAAEGEQPGTSVFRRDGTDVYHTYSSFARGGDILIGTFNYLDLTPLGRQFHVGEARRHDAYERKVRSTARVWWYW